MNVIVNVALEDTQTFKRHLGLISSLVDPLLTSTRAAGISEMIPSLVVLEYSTLMLPSLVVLEDPTPVISSPAVLEDPILSSVVPKTVTEQPTLLVSAKEAATKLSTLVVMEEVSLWAPPMILALPAPTKVLALQALTKLLALPAPTRFLALPATLKRPLL